MPPVCGAPRVRARRHSAPAKQGQLPAQPVQQPQQREPLEATDWQDELDSIRLWLAKEGAGSDFLDQRAEPPDPMERQTQLADTKINERTLACVDQWAALPTVSKEALSIIRRGLFVNIEKAPSHKYEEPNNKSFASDPKFGEEAILKLLETGAVEECKKDDLRCINPLSIAINSKDKKRLCLDLSRYVNTYTKTKRISLEAVNTFARTVRKGDLMVVFDLSR